MKKLLLLTVIAGSINAFSSVTCSTIETSSNGLPVFSVSFYETSHEAGAPKMHALLTDRNVSNISEPYEECESSSMINEGVKLSVFSCQNGGYSEDKSFSLYINEGRLEGSFQDRFYKEYGFESLKCDIHQ